VYNNQGVRVSYLETTYTYDNDPVTHEVPSRGWLVNTQTTWYNVAANTSHVLSSNAYTYDTAGLRLTNAVTNAAGSTRTETYTYDDLTRLGSVNYGDGGTQNYTFDPMGNRLSRQDSASGTTNYAYNAANMLTASTGTGASTYTNDADGDTLAGGSRGETWDSQNRLVGCSYGASTSTFKYGADGLRRQSTVNGTVDNYAYDGQSMVREMNASLVSQATYLTGLRGPEYRRNDTQTESDGQGHTFGLTRWYVYDGLGSVVGEVDPLGNLTCADEYDVYGAVRGRTGTATTAHGFVGCAGHLSDASTGLIYMRARYYDPSTGRFASEDPSKNGNNWLEYVYDNPINFADSTGKMPIDSNGKWTEPPTDWDELFQEMTEPLHYPATVFSNLMNKFVSSLKAFRDADPAGPDALDKEVAEVLTEKAEAIEQVEEVLGVGTKAVETNDETEAEE
jgi:RHS repeat-associated protein